MAFNPTNAPGPRSQKDKSARAKGGCRRPVLIWAAIVAFFGVLAVVIGPRLDTSFTVVEPVLPEGDVDVLATWFNEREAAVGGLRDDNAGRVLLADGRKEETSLALVYLHGFSASPGETTPLMDEVAAELEAHLVVPRLSGHGFVDDQLGAGASLQVWMDETAEALALAHKLADQVVVVGYSNGANLALLAQLHGPASLRADGFILLSPNFAPADPAARLLGWPWAAYWLPRVVGAERVRDPRNELHGQYWSHQYATQALFPMMAAVLRLRDSPLDELTEPVLMMYSELDTVVDIAVLRRRYEELGSAEKALVQVPNVEDPGGHLIAGNALSPGTTAWVRDEMVRFIREHLAAVN